MYFDCLMIKVFDPYHNTEFRVIENLILVETFICLALETFTFEVVSAIKDGYLP